MSWLDSAAVCPDQREHRSMRPARSPSLRRPGRGAGVVATLAVGGALTAYAVRGDLTGTTADAQAVLDSAAATIGTLLAYLLLGRFWESARVRDLLLSGF